MLKVERQRSMQLGWLHVASRLSHLHLYPFTANFTLYAYMDKPSRNVATATATSSTMAACRNFVQSCWTSTIAKGGHDSNVLSSMKVISARPGHLRTSLKIENRHLNNHKTLHGGVILSLTDTVTSLAVSTVGLLPPTGVSVNISAEFVRPGGTEGDELIGVGEVIKVGRTLAYTRVNFYTSDDKLVAYGSHTKHMGLAKATTGFSEDGDKEIPLNKAKL